MKKTNRKDLTLSTTTIRALVRTVEIKDLADVQGGVYRLSLGCNTGAAQTCA